MVTTPMLFLNGAADITGIGVMEDIATLVVTTDGTDHGATGVGDLDFLAMTLGDIVVLDGITLIIMVGTTEDIMDTMEDTTITTTTTTHIIIVTT